jgi:hypothetical protein
MSKRKSKRGLAVSPGQSKRGTALRKAWCALACSELRGASGKHFKERNDKRNGQVEDIVSAAMTGFAHHMTWAALTRISSCDPAASSNCSGALRDLTRLGEEG